MRCGGKKLIVRNEKVSDISGSTGTVGKISGNKVLNYTLIQRVAFGEFE